MEGTQGPWVIAHRGASTELPENTMAAFARALNYSGVAGIETDLRLSKDGVIVLIHDAVQSSSLSLSLPSRVRDGEVGAA